MIKKISLLITIAVIALMGYYYWPEPPLPTNSKITRLVVYKSKRELQVLAGSEILKTYKISLGYHPVGDKQKEGDGRTPEGVYTINDKNPNSGYH